MIHIYRPFRCCRGRNVHAASLAVVLLSSSAIVHAADAIKSSASLAAQNDVVRPLIIGGKNAAQGQYPFLGSFSYQEGSSSSGHICGASLLSPTVVMTAAHCVEDLDLDDAQLTLEVTFDRADLRRKDVGIVSKVARDFEGKLQVYMHPAYGQSTSVSSDVAVMRLDEPAFGIEPVVLPTPGSDVLERPGTMATVAGWGNTSRYEGVLVGSPMLQEVQVPLLAPRDCRFAYGGEFEEASMICAGVTGRDSCQGDSGGPLFHKVNDEPAVVQVGVVSWGIGCGSTGRPGVYTRLSSPGVQSWLQQYTGL